MAEKKQKKQPKKNASVGKSDTRHQTFFPRAGWHVDGRRLDKGGKICK